MILLSEVVFKMMFLDKEKLSPEDKKFLMTVLEALQKHQKYHYYTLDGKCFVSNFGDVVDSFPIDSEKMEYEFVRRSLISINNLYEKFSYLFDKNLNPIKGRGKEFFEIFERMSNKFLKGNTECYISPEKFYTWIFEYLDLISLEVVDSISSQTGIILYDKDLTSEIYREIPKIDDKWEVRCLSKIFSSDSLIYV